MVTANTQLSPPISGVRFWRAVAVHLNQAPICSCLVWDFTESTAQISVENPEVMPIDFVVRFSDNGSVARLCRTIGRVDNILKVELSPIAKAAKSDLKSDPVFI